MILLVVVPGRVFQSFVANSINLGDSAKFGGQQIWGTVPLIKLASVEVVKVTVPIDA
jgi:hypothetical protein